jgi:hypothetical protein
MMLEKPGLLVKWVFVGLGRCSDLTVSYFLYTQLEYPRRVGDS